MSDVITLKAVSRENFGTGAAKDLRRNGMIPAIIYGSDKKPVSIAIEEKEITKYYRKPQFISQIIEFEIGDKKYKVLPKAVDLHPIKDVVRHADFVFLNDKIQKMQIPVVYANKENCIGIKKGGYFNTVKRVLNILCPTDKITRKIEIDVTDLPIGTSIKAKDAILPEGAKLLDQADFVIASIIGKKGKSELEDAVAAEEQETGAEETAESK